MNTKFFLLQFKTFHLTPSSGRRRERITQALDQKMEEKEIKREKEEAMKKQACQLPLDLVRKVYLKHSLHLPCFKKCCLIFF